MLPRSVNFLRDFLSQPRILIAPMYEPLGYPLYTRARTRRGWKGKVTEEFADARFASHAHWKWKLACDIMEYNNQEAWWLIYCCYRGKQNQEASVMNPDSHHFFFFFFFTFCLKTRQCSVSSNTFFMTTASRESHTGTGTYRFCSSKKITLNIKIQPWTVTTAVCRWVY